MHICLKLTDIEIYIPLLTLCGPGSSVGIATGYRLDGPGIESRWGRDFLHLSRPALRPTQPPVQWGTGSFLGVKSGRGVMLTPHPLLVPWSWMGRATSLLSVRAIRPVQSLSACTRVQFTFTNTVTDVFPYTMDAILICVLLSVVIQWMLRTQNCKIDPWTSQIL